MEIVALNDKWSWRHADIGKHTAASSASVMPSPQRKTGSRSSMTKTIHATTYRPLHTEPRRREGPMHTLCLMIFNDINHVPSDPITSIVRKTIGSPLSIHTGKAQILHKICDSLRFSYTSPAPSQSMHKIINHQRVYENNDDTFRGVSGKKPIRFSSTKV